MTFLRDTIDLMQYKYEKIHVNKGFNKNNYFPMIISRKQQNAKQDELIINFLREIN